MILKFNYKKFFNDLKNKIDQKITALKFKKTKENPIFRDVIDKQFYEILNDPKKYIVNIKEFKNIVSLDSFSNDNNEVFDQILKNINDAIIDKKQIIFKNFAITWINPETTQFSNYPILVNDNDQLSQNLAIFNPYNSDDHNIVRIFTSLNRIIDFELRENNLHLLLNKNIMLLFSKENGYSLLCSKNVS